MKNHNYVAMWNCKFLMLHNHINTSIPLKLVYDIFSQKH